MNAPSFAKFPGQVQTQGQFPWDPRNVVGANNSRYPTLNSIPAEDRFLGLLVFDAGADPKGFFYLKDGITDDDWVPFGGSVAIQLDDQVTEGSANGVTSDGIFNYVENAKATPVTREWSGADLDGDNRLNLALGEKDIDQAMVFFINGIGQTPVTDFTVDAGKRYIEVLSNDFDPTQAVFQLVYFADLPIITQNQVDYLNVTNLTGPDQKILQERLPNGVGGNTFIPFDTEVKLDAKYTTEHIINGPTAYTLKAGSDNTLGERTDLLTANGIDIPEFSDDFHRAWFNYKNEPNAKHTLIFKPGRAGKVNYYLIYEDE